MLAFLILRVLTLQICFEVGKRCNFTAHRPGDHRVHEPGQALRFIMQHECHAGRISNGFKSVRTSRPCGARDNLKLDQLIGLALDDLIVAFNAPATRPFQALFVDRSHTRGFAWHALNIYHPRSPERAIRSIQNEIEYGIDWPVNGDTFFCMSHNESPFEKFLLDSAIYPQYTCSSFALIGASGS